MAVTFINIPPGRSDQGTSNKSRYI